MVGRRARLRRGLRVGGNRARHAGERAHRRRSRAHAVLPDGIQRAHSVRPFGRGRRRVDGRADDARRVGLRLSRGGGRLLWLRDVDVAARALSGGGCGGVLVLHARLRRGGRRPRFGRTFGVAASSRPRAHLRGHRAREGARSPTSPLPAATPGTPGPSAIRGAPSGTRRSRRTRPAACPRRASRAVRP